MTAHHKISCSWRLLFLLLVLTYTNVNAKEIEDQYWPVMHEAYFSGKPIQDGSQLIKIDAPIQAEDAAIVPFAFSINDELKAKLNIQKVYVLVDANPIQLTGTFHYYQPKIPIQISTRIRLEKNTYVRVIAEGQDKQLYMHKVAIKTPGGGCGGGGASDEAKLRAEAGKMKFRVSQHDHNKTLSDLHFHIKHPMRTGFERTTQGYFAKAYHIKRLDFSDENGPMMSIDVGVGISADPYFQFASLPHVPAIIDIKALDNEGKTYQQQFPTDVHQEAKSRL